MRKREKLTTEIIKERARQVHGDKYDLSPIEFISCREKISYRCYDHGMKTQNLFDFLDGHGCWECHWSHLKTWTSEEDNILRENYKQKKAAWCARKLNKSEHAVRGRAQVLGVAQKQKIIHPHVPAFMLTSIIGRAKQKNILVVNIDDEFIWDLYLQQDKKCALTGWPIYFSSNNKNNTVSVDRIDSAKHYTRDNLQLTHKIVNRCKLNCPEDFFYNICKDITEYRKSDFNPRVIEWEWDIWNDTEHPIVQPSRFDNTKYQLKDNKIEYTES